jgi:hypothetical protein
MAESKALKSQILRMAKATGKDGKPKHTQAAIALKHQVSRAYVHQLVKDAGR